MTFRPEILLACLACADSSAGSTDTGDLVTQCYVDVIAGSDPVSFYRAWSVTVVDGVITSTPLGDFTDESLSVPYTVVGTATPPQDVGVNAETKLLHIILKDGETWSPGSMVYAFDAVVIAGQPEVLDSSGNATQLETGQSVNWSRTDSAPLDASFSITARAGSVDCVSIAVNSLGVQ